MIDLYKIMPGFKVAHTCLDCKYHKHRNDGYGNIEWIGCNLNDTRQNYLSLSEWLRDYEVSKYNVCNLWENTND